MPGLLLNRSGGNSTSSTTTTNGVQWIDQQQYLIQTYRDIRASLSQLEHEIDAARLRVTDWSSHRAPGGHPLTNAVSALAASTARSNRRTNILSSRTSYQYRTQLSDRPIQPDNHSEPARARSLSHASTASTLTESSLISCCSHDTETTGEESSCPTFSSASSCRSSEALLSSSDEMRFNAATLLTAFLMATTAAASHSANSSCLASPQAGYLPSEQVSEPFERKPPAPRTRNNRSASPTR